MTLTTSTSGHTKSLPAKVDVVIIGAGIIGMTAALFLAQRGLSVTVCEKGKVAGEQSSRNWGWVRKMGRDPAELPLSIASANLWAQMNELVGAETGFRETGIFYLCRTEKEIAKYEDWLQHARDHKLDSHILGPKQVSEQLTDMAGKCAGALFTPSDGRAEPSLATQAIALEVQRQGVQIVENCAVRGFETKAGQIGTVITEHGPIDCDQVVLATGAWTRLFCGSIGIDFPQLKVFGSVMRTGPVSGAPEFAVAGSDFAFRKRLDGGYTIAQKNANVAQIVPDSFRLLRKFLPAFRSEGNEIMLRFGRTFLEEAVLPKRWSLSEPTPFEEKRVLDPNPSERILDKGLRNLSRSFPVFKDAKIVERWGCAIDVTPDAIPVISPVPTHPGLLIASGFSGHGFGIGPGAGHLIADIITDQDSIVDPAPYKLSRLIDVG